MLPTTAASQECLGKGPKKSVKAGGNGIGGSVRLFSAARVKLAYIFLRNIVFNLHFIPLITKL